ncbi:MAG: lipopolysaccharide heptosyltransferase II [Candidatus Cloacimonetes bacterium]|nr:lipopolysaccharide heptosyltransferase II [Candidatus Cloacimonadota bacterium]
MKILIVHTAFLGDVILITPLIRTVKKLFPNSILDVLVIPQTYEVLQHNPYINEILVFDKRKNKILNFLKTLFLLRKKQYDIALLPHSSMTTSFLIFLSHIKKRIGFKRWLSSLLLTHRIPFRNAIHRIEKNLDLLKPFSAEIFDIQTELFPDAEDFEKAESLLSELDPVKKKIAFAPGSVWYTKRWLETYYKELAQKLIEAGFSIILVGSPEEKELCDKIKPTSDALNFAGNTTVLESAAILKNCDLLICNDCGALHIANAMETDVFAIFGPTVKQIGYFPYRENDFIFETDIPCRPCGSHGRMKCPLEHHNCMKLIKPEKVFLKVINYFEKSIDRLLTKQE